MSSMPRSVGLSAWLGILIVTVCGAELPFESLNYSQVRAWIITPESQHGIHRFFDSSPISPSNQLIATTILPSFLDSVSASPLTTSYKQAGIQVTNITSGISTLFDLTDAWDSQLGAQVQWGAMDSELFYNILQDFGLNVPGDTNIPSGVHQSNGCSVLRGVRLNVHTEEKNLLQCPVYHVSNDGKLAAAPNLLKIHHTQKGYGVRVLDTATHKQQQVRGAAHNDGLYITNTVTGECRLLVTLHRLAQAAGLDTEHTPIYGFHTKFSSDGSLIMFVVRTMEKPVAPRNGLVRVQHLFVVDALGIAVRRMISWASYPFLPARCHAAESTSSLSSQGNGTTKCAPVHLRDGNHPNWVPHTHRISMNLQKNKPKSQPEASTAEHVLSTVARLVNQQPTARESEWNIVNFDVDAHADNFMFHYHHPVRVVCDATRSNHTHQQWTSMDRFSKHNVTSAEVASPHALQSATQLLINVDHDKGSGHPIYHPSGKYIITDAYLKEAQVLHQQGSVAHKSDTVPLRLIEIATQREVQLLQMQVQRTLEPQSLLSQAQHHFKNAVSYISSALTGVDQPGSSTATTLARSTGTHGDSRNSTCSASQGLAGPASATPPPSPTSPLVLVLEEDKSWRCDLHPAWSRDFQWVAINGRPRGRERQVVLLYLGPDLGAMFP